MCILVRFDFFLLLLLSYDIIVSILQKFEKYEIGKFPTNSTTHHFSYFMHVLNKKMYEVSRRKTQAEMSKSEIKF